MAKLRDRKALQALWNDACILITSMDNWDKQVKGIEGKNACKDLCNVIQKVMDEIDDLNYNIQVENNSGVGERLPKLRRNFSSSIQEITF